MMTRKTAHGPAALLGAAVLLIGLGTGSALAQSSNNTGGAPSGCGGSKGSATAPDMNCGTQQNKANSNGTMNGTNSGTSGAGSSNGAMTTQPTTGSSGTGTGASSGASGTNSSSGGGSGSSNQ
jgi:hypothetical protein